MSANESNTLGEKSNPVPKPDSFDLSKFKSKRPAAGKVNTLQEGLPIHNISGAKDFVRLHPADDYWSDELCFVLVPIKGAQRESLHLIDEDVAMTYLQPGKIARCRLALAAKPHDIFFLCKVPTQNPDNKWNMDNVAACEQAKRNWTEVSSRGAEGAEGYRITYARDADAFPEPNWPEQSLDDIIQRAFANRLIVDETSEALGRLLGAKLSVA